MCWIGPAIVHRKVCIIQVIRWAKSGSFNSRNIFHFRFSSLSYCSSSSFFSFYFEVRKTENYQV